LKKRIKLCLVGGEDAYKRIPLAEHLIKEYFDVTIIGTADYSYPKEINFIKYNLNRSFNLISDIKTILEYRKIFKNNRFDLIQTFDTKPAFLVPIALFGIKSKIVRTITGLGKVFVNNDPRNLPIKLIYIFLHYTIRTKVKYTTFQNKEDKEIFLKNKLITKKNHLMIYGSGIDLNKVKDIAPRKSNPFTVICVSRIIYEKGILDYIEAAKICHNQGFNIKFLLVGPLEENSEILNENILNSYAKYVEWLGKRSDINNLLFTSDAFILPTFYREGFARVLLEASAIGLPLITTDVPGVRDIARHMKEALIVPIKNPEKLAEAIITLGTDKELADKLATNALSNVKKYSLEIISKNYSDLYQTLL
tara:strand:+ start:6007 stop:7098 length:1092 start_codon:yes stop_codon:yes gene_type:complete